MSKDIQIRNSTVDFLVFTRDSEERKWNLGKSPGWRYMTYTESYRTTV